MTRLVHKQSHGGFLSYNMMFSILKGLFNNQVAVKYVLDPCSKHGSLLKLSNFATKCHTLESSLDYNLWNSFLRLCVVWLFSMWHQYEWGITDLKGSLDWSQLEKIWINPWNVERGIKITLHISRAPVGNSERGIKGDQTAQKTWKLILEMTSNTMNSALTVRNGRLSEVCKGHLNHWHRV